MILDLLYRKKIGVPYISIILIFSCLIVSIPTYFSPKLYFVFGSGFQGYNATYLWQNIITNQFEHGNFYIETKIAQGLPLLVHLIGNVIIIVELNNISSQRVVEKCGFIKNGTKMILNSGEAKEKPFYYYRLKNNVH